MAKVGAEVRKGTVWILSGLHHSVQGLAGEGMPEAVEADSLSRARAYSCFCKNPGKSVLHCDHCISVAPWGSEEEHVTIASVFLGIEGNPCLQ